MRKPEKLVQGRNGGDKKTGIEVHDIKIPVEFGVSFMPKGEGSVMDCGVDCGCGPQHGTPCPNW